MTQNRSPKGHEEHVPTGNRADLKWHRRTMLFVASIKCLECFCLRRKKTLQRLMSTAPWVHSYYAYNEFCNY